MSDIEKIITDDGTITFYNKAIGDIYHSKVGAYTEALEKFIKPSGIIEKLDSYSHINVLDVCFGPGYNSKVLLSEIFKRDPAKSIVVTAIEIDPEIILKSLDVSFEGYPDILKNFFDAFLHKVYYTTISNRYSLMEPFESEINNFKLKLFINDARQIVKSFNESFDLVLLDPFSPNKTPALWSVDFFKCLYSASKEDAVLLTYSSSASVRGGLIEAGYHIGNTAPVGRKSPGTIASKNKNLIISPLSPEEKIILGSKAGIPYYDPPLNWDSSQIINNRNEQQKKSSRISSSKLKNINKNQPDR